MPTPAERLLVADPHYLTPAQVDAQVQMHELVHPPQKDNQPSPKPTTPVVVFQTPQT